MSNPYKSADRGFGHADPFHQGEMSRAELREVALLKFATGLYDGCFTADDLLAIMEVLEG